METGQMQEKKEISCMKNWYDIARENTANSVNPEWKIARYEGSEQERGIWYHGTRASNLPSILSHGLIADPKKRAWGDHDWATFNSPSQASIKGVYVTRSMLTARISAQHNLPRGEERVIVIMELQPRSLVADEDSLTRYVSTLLNNAKYGVMEWQIAEIYMANVLKTNREYVQKVKDEYVENGVNLIERQYGPIHPKLRLRIAELLNNNWEMVLSRQSAHINDHDWNRAFYRNISPKMNELMSAKRKAINSKGLSEEKANQAYHDFVETLKPPKPDAGVLESQYSQFMDELTRTVKRAAVPRSNPEGENNTTARSLENIGFKGSNRIIGIVQIDKDMNVKLVYGTIPDDFKKQWKKTTGELRIINKTAMTDRMYKTAYRTIWYHGTLMSNYQRVMSEGLLAEPQTRLWDKQDLGDSVAPSKASLSGVYLTHELFDAIFAPDNALDAKDKKNEDKSILLAVVQADTQAVFIDEDAISFEISSAIQGVSDYLVCLVYISGVTGEDEPYFNRIRDRFVERQMEKLEKKFNFNHPELIERVKQILRDGFINTLTRQVSHADQEHWNRAYLDIVRRHQSIHKDKSKVPVPPMPSAAKGEEMFRELMDQLTRTLKFSKHQQEKENVRGEWWESGRYPNNISFSGSTKIAALLEIVIRSNQKDSYLDPHQYKYKVLYGDPPQQFLDDWKRMVDMSKKTKDIDQKKGDEEEAYEDWYKIAQEQQSFGFYSDPEYQWENPKDDSCFRELAKTKGLSPQLLDEVVEASEASNIYEIKMLLNQFGFVWEELKLKDNLLIVVSFDNENYIIDDFEDPSVVKAEEWLSNIFDHDLYSYVDYGDFNQEFWDEADGAILYHATQPENKEEILKDGLMPMDKARGISNRSTGSAVFTSDDPDSIGESYGSLIFQIDVGQMKRDEYMPPVSMEGPFDDVKARELLAHKLGIENYDFTSEYASEGLYENTVVFFGSIPPKYLSIYSE